MPLETMILMSGAELFRGPDWMNGFHLICDYREVTSFDVDAADMRKLSAQDSSFEDLLNRSRCAVVADRDVIFGMARMWEAMSEQNGLRTMVFRELDEACRWLSLGTHVLSRLTKRT